MYRKLGCIGNHPVLSKRAKSVAKCIHLSLFYINFSSSNEGPEIWLKHPDAPGLKWIINYEKEKESSVYPVLDSSFRGPQTVHFLYLYDNGIEDLKQMAEHICEVFRSPIADVRISEESLIDWIINLQTTIPRAFISKGVITSVETMDRVFKNLKGTEYFDLEAIAIDESFQYTEPIPFRCISLWDPFWLSLPSILNGTNSVILSYGSKFTPTDINTILKEWQKGTKLQNLEFMEIETFELLNARKAYLEIWADLDWTDGGENDGRPMEVRIDDEWTLMLPEGVPKGNLIRNDGMIGSIFESFELHADRRLELCFSFQVWKKQN
ncbi:hypothetical protein B9Z55_012270 [Caenorhabditis nigoni]|uniref:Sdz-33 F-box domain-containing protein n=2 Tax=Caenorhabditis nigoni TaxID=1611254 RepID=A0A2G5TWH2_9PELO|nr:hypothetical protein B9Z55_012270 [Caenorhabditis nigoni]